MADQESAKAEAWIAEANRYSTIAEQSANRVHVTLSVGLGGVSAIVAAAFVAKNVVVLAFTPVAACLVIAVAAVGTLESLYASIYHAHAEAQLRRALSVTAQVIPLYRRGPGQPRRFAIFGILTWGFIVFVFLTLSVVNGVASFVLTTAPEWSEHADELTPWVLAAIYGIVVVAIVVLLTAFLRAWGEMITFQRENVDELLAAAHSRGVRRGVAKARRTSD
jgi:hypothetical protein